MSYAFLLTVAFKGTVVAIVAWLAASCLRRRSAATRHLVWTAAAGALLALPLLSIAVPEWRLPDVVSVDTGVVFRAFGVAAAATDDSVPAAGAVGVARTPAHRRHFNAYAAVAVLWGAGTLAGLIEMLVAYVRLARLRRSARAVQTAPVPVLEIPGGMPAAFGVLHPVVFLPAEANAWTWERRRLVLMHELAHVRRSDPATHLLARTALSLYWWNPLVWLAWREFLKERERAADDLVLNAGARASDYAGHLLDIARTLQPAPASAGAAVAMARRSQLEGRLLMILDSNVNRKAAARMAPFAAAALAVALVAPFAAVRAQDVAQPAITPEMESTIRTAWAQKNQEVVDQAAAVYMRQRKYPEAQKLLEAGLAIREQTSGPQSAAYAAGLVKLGDLAARRHQPKEAEAFYTKAISLGDRPEVVPALLALGMGERDYEQAFTYFQRALNADYNGPTATRALMWMAVARQRQGRIPEAEGYFNDAISRTPSVATVDAMKLYARLIEDQGRTSDAAAMQARAQDAWKALYPGQNPGRAASDMVFRVGKTVTPPSLLWKLEPEYSEEARAAKFQGTVVLYVEVTPEGQAANARVVKSLGLGLDEKAIEAVQQWKFKPGAKDGTPVTVAATIEVNFRLL